MARSRAKDLLERILDGGVASIDEMIASRVSEELFLDFKRSSDDGGGSHLSTTDRRSLARAISGFGNSEGGVVIWGVDCSEIETSGDVARGKHPISDPHRFKSWLEGAVSGTTVPPHEAVEHFVLEGADGDFVVTYVPRSRYRPLQELHGRRYYIRSGSSFSPAPHGVLLGMFGHGPRPEIFHMWAIGQTTQQPIVGELTSLAFSVGFLLSSYGPGIARDLYVSGSLATPSRESTVSVEGVAEADWDAYWIPRVRRLSVTSKPHVGLAPDAVRTVLSLKCVFKLPITGPWKWELSFGHGDSPVYRLQGGADADTLSQLFDEYSSSHTVRTAHEWTTELFGVPPDDPRRPEST